MYKCLGLENVGFFGLGCGGFVEENEVGDEEVEMRREVLCDVVLLLDGRSFEFVDEEEVGFGFVLGFGYLEMDYGFVF